MASDPYVDEKTGTLHNKLGIKNEHQLARVEGDLSALRIAELKIEPVKGNFDRAHLDATHKYIFQDVYQWAGQSRTVDISKGDSPFARTQFIENSTDRLLTRLDRENGLKGLEQPQFAERAAYYMSELNAIHPYREGNGRATRVFIEQVAERAGHQLDFSGISREQINSAHEKAHLSGDHRHLVPLIQKGLEAGRGQNQMER